MINLTEKVYEYATKMLKEKFLQSAEQIQGDYNIHKGEIIKSYLKVFETLLQNTENQQKKGKKGEIQYICISYLRSSLYTKSYQFQIDFYDTSFYLDTMECSQNWKSDFIMKYFEEDIRSTAEYIKRTKIRVLDWELEEIRKNYIYQYYYLVQKFCEDKASEVMELIKHSSIKTTEPMFLLYGGYMERTKVIGERKGHE